MTQKIEPSSLESENITIDKDNIQYVISDWCDKLQRINPRVAWLYCWWNRELLHRKMLWIVWPRKPSTYWQKVLHHICNLFPLFDLVTLSGWAQWIDTLVHELSLEKNIPTIVVLGWWIEYYQNSWKYHFLQKIVDRWWLIVSEYPWDTPPKKYTFPQRNRIIAWLSDMVIVPEASIWSGSLITVDKAIDYWTPVYAPMQDIFAVSGNGVYDYIVTGTIKPLSRTMIDSLVQYFAKKPWENLLLTVHNSANLVHIHRKSNKSLEGDLIEASIRELGL